MRQIVQITTLNQTDENVSKIAQCRPVEVYQIARRYVLSNEVPQVRLNGRITKAYFYMLISVF